MKLLFTWLIRILGLLLLVGASFWMQDLVLRERLQLAELSSQLEESTQQVVRGASLELDLEQRSPDIARIEALVPSRENVEGFVSLLDAESKRRNLLLNIPKVQERQEYDQLRNPIPVTGQIQYVVVGVVASGEPDELMQFLHFAETTPYVVHLESWNLKTESSKRIDVANQLAPVDRAPARLADTGYLEADFLLGVKHEPK